MFACYAATDDDELNSMMTKVLYPRRSSLTAKTVVATGHTPLGCLCYFALTRGPTSVGRSVVVSAGFYFTKS